MTPPDDDSPAHTAVGGVRKHRWLLAVLVGALVVGHAIVLRSVRSHVGVWGALVSVGVVALVAVKHVGLLAMLIRYRRRQRQRLGR